MPPANIRAWIAALGAIVLVSVGVCAKRCLDVDRCLDAGGHWNHERGECEYE